MFQNEGIHFKFDRLGGQTWANRSRWQWQTALASPDPADPPFPLNDPVGANLSASVSDHVTLTEAILGDVAPAFMGEGDTITVAESCTVTVVAGGVANLLASATDTITLTETLSQRETAMLAFVTDPVTVAETLRFTGITIKGVIADTVTLTETITTAGRFVLSVTDAITLTETTDQTCTPLRVAGDDRINVAEIPVLVMGEPGILYVALADALTLTEYLNAFGNPIVGAVSEAITVADIPAVRAGDLKPLSDELVALTEALGVCISPLRVASDDLVAVGEATAISFNPMRVSQGDTITVTDSPTLGVGVQAGTHLLANDAPWVARFVKKERIINV